MSLRTIKREKEADGQQYNSADEGQGAAEHRERVRELLAQAGKWCTEEKALQLAMCLTGDALTSLLLLSPADRSDYDALVGALKRRFGLCSTASLLRSELCSR